MTMKKLFVPFMTVIFFTLISCSNNQYMDDDLSSYVRYSADSLIEGLEWTSEIDGDLLSAKIRGSDGFDKKVKANGLNMFLSGTESSYEPLYPYLKGFASLSGI